MSFMNFLRIRGSTLHLPIAVALAITVSARALFVPAALDFASIAAR